VTNFTPLHTADLADPFDYSTHVNQLILAKQLVEHGANVNAVEIPDGKRRCTMHAHNVTNLDFVEYLGSRCRSKRQDHTGLTPLMFTCECSRCGQISAELAYHGRRQYYHSMGRRS
jgi:hypothetical protein